MTAAKVGRDTDELGLGPVGARLGYWGKTGASWDLEGDPL